MFSNAFKILRRAILVCLFLLTASCATAPAPVPAPAESTAKSVSTPSGTSTGASVPPSPGSSVESVTLPSSPPQDTSNPRTLAALQITEEGRLLLESGRLDQAVSLLERALNLNPKNGAACYYLAEAWLIKGDKKRAETFNHLAEVHLRQDRKWQSRVAAQKKRIEAYDEPHS